MSGGADASDWGLYWRHAAPGVCTGANPVLERLLTPCWAEFAQAVPRRSRILDLATGNGAVLRKLQAAGRQFHLSGVDFVADPPPAPKGITIRGGVRLEALPFRDEQFDAVTAQFGYEYADRAAAAAEAMRVLRRGGHLRFVIHHSDSPILSHNMRRRDELEWLLTQSTLFDQARQYLAASRRLALPMPPAIAGASPTIRQHLPSATAAIEVAQALVQIVAMRAHGAHGADRAIELLDALEHRAGAEAARIGALVAASRDRGGIAEGCRILTGHGGLIDDPRELMAPDGARLAWVLTGTKEAAAA